MTVAEVPLVPPARLAALLSSTRSEIGLDLVDLSRRSNGIFSPSDLEAFERGRRPLDEPTIATLIDLYQLDAGPIVPGRNELVLDLVEHSIQVGDWWTSFDSPVVDDVLERYVALVHLMRGNTGNESLVLRTADLDVLSQSLEEPAGTIRARIESLIDSQSLPRRRRLLQSMTAVAGAGILVGVTAIGAIVLVNGGEAPTVTNQFSAPSSAGAATIAGAQSGTQSGTQSGSLAAAEPVTLVPASPDATAQDAAPQDAASQDTAQQDTAPQDETLAPAEPVVLSDRAQAIEDAIDWDFRAALPSWTIEHAGPHLEWRGVTNSLDKVVTLFDRPDTSVDDAAAILAHEIGHAIDLQVMTDAQRTAWLELRGMEAPWWALDGRSDFAVGAGDFAEAVAAVLVGAPSRSDFGPFTAAQLAYVTDLLPPS